MYLARWYITSPVGLMKKQELLRTIAKLHTRADRAEHLTAKYEQALLAERQGSAQTRQELEELVKVAEVLYETNCRMGLVLDFLIGKQGIKQPNGSSMSFDAMFNLVVRQAEQVDKTEQATRTGSEEETIVHRSPSPAEEKIEIA